jgi:hypothetical protein
MHSNAKEEEVVPCVRPYSIRAARCAPEIARGPTIEALDGRLGNNAGYDDGGPAADAVPAL